MRRSKSGQLMSAVGQTRTSERFRFMSAQAPKAELRATQCDVAEVPIPDFAME
jgi:hypothetical protein